MKNYCKINKKTKGKFVGYIYVAKPSPHRIPAFEIYEPLTLEELKDLEKEK
jgi:hypothetical protein